MDINSHDEIRINILNIIGQINIWVKSALFQLFCPTHVYIYKYCAMVHVKYYIIVNYAGNESQHI